MGMWKGYSQGFIVAIFSFAAFFIGLAAALKLSTAVAAWAGTTFHTGGRWLPFVCFLVVMLGTAFLVRRLAGLIETAVAAVMLGWLNRLAGMALMALIYACIYSIILFYLNKMGLLSLASRENSLAWKWIAPLGPASIDMLARLIPWLKDMFADLEQFFGGMAPDAPGSSEPAIHS